MARGLFALLFAALLLGAAWWWLSLEPLHHESKHKADISTVPAVPKAFNQQPMHKQSAGTNDDIDAATVHFRQGRFYLDESLRFYFEYFIMHRGEAGEIQLKQKLKADACKRYNRATCDYLAGLFGRYLHYLDAQAEVAANHQGEFSYQEIQQQKQALQQRLFNKHEQQALFSDAYLEKYSHENSVQAKYDKYNALAKNIKSQQKLDALRAEVFGAEAVAKFKELDAKKAAWQQRLQQYYCAKLQIQQSPGIAGADKKRQIQSLQQRLFEGAEVTRVRALDGQNALNVDENAC